MYGSVLNQSNFILESAPAHVARLQTQRFWNFSIRGTSASRVPRRDTTRGDRSPDRGGGGRKGRVGPRPRPTLYLHSKLDKGFSSVVCSFTMQRKLLTRPVKSKALQIASRRDLDNFLKLNLFFRDRREGIATPRYFPR